MTKVQKTTSLRGEESRIHRKFMADLLKSNFRKRKKCSRQMGQHNICLPTVVVVFFWRTSADCFRAVRWWALTLSWKFDWEVFASSSVDGNQVSGSNKIILRSLVETLIRSEKWEDLKYDHSLSLGRQYCHPSAIVSWENCNSSSLSLGGSSFFRMTIACWIQFPFRRPGRRRRRLHFLWRARQVW